MTVAGITYKQPTATLLHASPLVNAEIAGRTAYSSFAASEHPQVRNFNGTPVEDVDSSELMTQLCHVYFHDSVAEHINLTYNLSTSRGTLQELARHRIASYTVQSTRYTMSSVINAFIAANCVEEFADLLLSLNMFVVEDDLAKLEIYGIYQKLVFQYNRLGETEFLKAALSKDALSSGALTLSSFQQRFTALESAKKKRNVGDAFKHIVTDNWKVHLVVTFNLRSLKNFFQLRDSGSAYFQIRELAQVMKAVTPPKYLNLILKQK